MFPRHGASETESSLSSTDMGEPLSAGSSSSSTMSMMMKPFLHFTGGDVVLFEQISPSSAGGIVGTCLIFFFIAIVSRYAAAASRGVQRRNAIRSNTLLQHHNSQDSEAKEVVLPTVKFILSQELARAGLFGVEIILGYILMLVVMTFNASYIISIVFGAVLGEFAFGRLNRN